jgi:hypothetical protein
MEEMIGQLEILIASLLKEFEEEKIDLITSISEDLILQSTKIMEEKDLNMTEALAVTLIVKYEILKFIGEETGLLNLEEEEKSDQDV